MDLEASGRATLTAPSELAGPLPRTVTLSSNDDGQKAVVVASLLFILGGVLLGWTGYDDVQQFQRRTVLRSDGREVVGEVTGFSHPRGGPTKVKYRFVVHGITYSGRAAVPNNPGPGTSLNESDHFLVRFLPSNPAVNHRYDWEWSPYVGLVPIVFQVLFFTIGSLLLGMLCRDRKLAREGKAALAIASSCIRSDKSFRVEYEFRTEDGVPMQGTGDCKEQQGPGEQIWILYLPQRPRRNQIYPLLSFDVAG